jgi:hypothetical protein
MSLSSEIATDTAAMPAVSQAEAPAKRAGKARLLSLADLDSRTRAARIVAETRTHILEDLGGADRLSTIQLSLAEHLALNEAMLRDMAVRWLKGEHIEPTQVVTIQNTYNRTAAMLGIERQARDIAPDLASCLKQGGDG